MNQDQDIQINILPGHRTENIVIVPQTFVLFKTNTLHQKPPAFLHIFYVDEDFPDTKN